GWGAGGGGGVAAAHVVALLGLQAWGGSDGLVDAKAAADQLGGGRADRGDGQRAVGKRGVLAGYLDRSDRIGGAQRQRGHRVGGGGNPGRAVSAPGGRRRRAVGGGHSRGIRRVAANRFEVAVVAGGGAVVGLVGSVGQRSPTDQRG